MARVNKFRRYPNTFNRQSTTFYGGSANQLPERRDILYLQIAGGDTASNTFEAVIDQKLIVHDPLPIRIDNATVNGVSANVDIIAISGNTITFACPDFNYVGVYYLYIPPFFPGVRTQLGGFLQGGTWGFEIFI